MIRPQDKTASTLFEHGPYRVVLVTRSIASKRYQTPYSVTDQRRPFGKMTIARFEDFDSAVEYAKRLEVHPDEG